MKLKESSIQRAILDYLEALGICHWRCNLGGVRARGASGGGWAKNPMKGFPDIAALIEGKLVGIEVKRPGGTMSPEQRMWRDKLNNAGARYIIATSVADVRMVIVELKSSKGLEYAEA